MTGHDSRTMRRPTLVSFLLGVCTRVFFTTESTEGTKARKGRLSGSRSETLPFSSVSVSFVASVVKIRKLHGSQPVSVLSRAGLPSDNETLVLKLRPVI
jgi:hypothetical protein